MQIILNGEPRDIAADATIGSVLATLAVPQKTIVVQQNGDIVARAEFETTPLMEGDTIELIRFVGGG